MEAQKKAIRLYFEESNHTINLTENPTLKDLAEKSRAEFLGLSEFPESGYYFVELGDDGTRINEIRTQ